MQASSLQVLDTRSRGITALSVSFRLRACVNPGRGLREDRWPLLSLQAERSTVTGKSRTRAVPYRSLPEVCAPLAVAATFLVTWRSYDLISFVTVSTHALPMMPDSSNRNVLDAKGPPVPKSPLHLSRESYVRMT